MKLAIAGDSAGAPLAKNLAAYLNDRKDIELEISELSEPPNGEVEYYANLSERVCLGVLDGSHDRAILVCGTGIGVCLSANKIPGIRAAQTHDTYSAERAVLSNNAQVITMGARVIGLELAKVIADTFLAHEFSEGSRSIDNIIAVAALDAKYNASQK